MRSLILINYRRILRTHTTTYMFIFRPLLFTSIILFLCPILFSQAPTITTFTPRNAGTGEIVLINGTNFSSITAVTFGGVAAQSFTVISTTQIQAIVGSGATGSVGVTKSGFSTVNATGFTFSNIPTVTGITTDFGLFWKTNVISNNPVLPNNSHSLLSFTYGGVTYSTGVNDALLVAQGEVFTPGRFSAFPAILNGTTSGASLFIAAGSALDGNIGVGLINHPNIRDLTIQNVLSDGPSGLNLGTGYTNLPTSATSEFVINSLDPTKITDNEPDIIITQIADPTGTATDTYRFIDANNQTVGNAIQRDLSTIAPLGTYALDLFSVTTGIPFSQAKAISASSANTTRQIRFMAFRLSDFGINSGNYTQITKLLITPSGVTDQAFVAYNSNAINVPPSVARNLPASSVIICLSGGEAVMRVNASSAINAPLSYQWFRSTDGGTTYVSISDDGNFSGTTTSSLTVASAQGGDRYRVEVTEGVTGYVTTSDAFTITAIAESPLGGTLNPSSISNCLNANVAPNSISVNPTGGTGSYIYQWRVSSTPGGPYTDVPGGNERTLTIDLFPVGVKYYQVEIVSGCLSHTSSEASVTISGAEITSTTPGVICSSGSATLSATASGGTLNWFSAASGGSSLGSGGSFNTPTISATTTYFVSTTLSGCTSIRVPVQAIVASTINLTSSNFSIQSPTEPCVGSGANILLTSTALPNGTHSVTYSITGANTVGPITTSITTNQGFGSFTTVPLSNPGANTITISTVTIGACNRTPSSGNTLNFNTVNTLPNTTDFSVSASATCLGSSTDIQISSSSLATGQYIVSYNVTGTNTIATRNTILSFTAGSPGTGSFSIPDLSSSGSNNVVEVTSIAFLSSPTCQSSLLASSTSFESNPPLGLDPGIPVTDCVSNAAIPITRGARASNFSALSWSSPDATGTFQQNTTADALTNTTFAPSAADQADRSRILTLTGTGLSGCANVEKTKPLTLDLEPVGGTVADASAVCSGTNTSNLSLSGHSGNIVRWESAPVADFSSGVSSIPNTTTTLNQTNLNSTSFYRAVLANGTCPNTNSVVGRIPVDPTSAGGNVNNQSVPQGQTPNPVFVSGFTGQIVEWHKASSSDFSSFSTLAITNDTLFPNDLGTTSPQSFFRAVVQSGTCPSTFSTFGFVEDLGPLPVDLLHAEAKCTNSGIQFLWTTLSEIQNKAFTIAFSKDLVHWETVDTIQGSGFSQSIRHYQWTLPSQFSNGYLSLWQIDFDGTKHFKTTVATPQCIPNQDFNLFPNPNHGTLNLSPVPPFATFEIYHLTGKLAQVGKCHEDRHFLWSHQLEPGWYVLIFPQHPELGAHKFLVH